MCTSPVSGCNVFFLSYLSLCIEKIMCHLLESYAISSLLEVLLWDAENLPCHFFPSSEVPLMLELLQAAAPYQLFVLSQVGQGKGGYALWRAKQVPGGKTGCGSRQQPEISNSRRPFVLEAEKRSLGWQKHAHEWHPCLWIQKTGERTWQINRSCSRSWGTEWWENGCDCWQVDGGAKIKFLRFITTWKFPQHSKIRRGRLVEEKGGF